MCLDVAKNQSCTGLPDCSACFCRPVLVFLTAVHVSADGTNTPPLVFLSAFDASCLDFRLLLPLLAEQGVQAWALDLVGWGFTEAGVVSGQGEIIGPAQRRAHMLAFWQQKVLVTCSAACLNASCAHMSSASVACLLAWVVGSCKPCLRPSLHMLWCQDALRKGEGVMHA